MNAGAVDSHRISDGMTCITLTSDYDPQGFLESIGAVLGFMDRRVDSDLMRFKQFIESRGSVTGGWRDTISDHPETTP